MDSFSVVAPVCLTERGDRPWRRAVNAGARLRLGAMLRTFAANCPASTLAEFTIVCPEADEAEISHLARDSPLAHRIRVIPEADFLDLAGAGGQIDPRCDGWNLQQIIKLLYHRHAPSPTYLTLDSDIVTLWPITPARLLGPSGRIRCGVEAAGDYERLYMADVASRETALKAWRYAVSRRILGYGRRPPGRIASYGETPVMLHREAVAEMTRKVETQLGAPLAFALSRSNGWTEYGLYFMHLETTGRLETLYELGDRNSLLDLDRSVWQPSAFYRSRRSYDFNHFFAGAGPLTAPFVAIQSWVSPSTWLPEGCGSLADFYGKLELWIDAANGRATWRFGATRLDRGIRL